MDKSRPILPDNGTTLVEIKTRCAHAAGLLGGSGRYELSTHPNGFDLIWSIYDGGIGLASGLIVLRDTNSYQRSMERIISDVQAAIEARSAGEAGE